LLIHIVLFKLKAKDPAVVAKAREMLLNLPAQIPQIRYFEVGVNVAESTRAYDFSLYSRFESREDLAAYQAHPRHVVVADYLRSVCEAMPVVDYES
jgi:hypothetical protein